MTVPRSFNLDHLVNLHFPNDLNLALIICLIFKKNKKIYIHIDMIFIKFNIYKIYLSTPLETRLERWPMKIVKNGLRNKHVVVVVVVVFDFTEA